MYQEFYKMNALPFTGLPDLNFFFGGDGYKTALANLVTSIDARQALIAVLGQEGLGKTTIAQMVEVLLGDRVKLIRMADPFAGCADILTFVASRLGVASAGSSHVDLIDKIYSALLAPGSDQSRVLMVVDDAHLLSLDGLKAIYLLSNLQTPPGNLIQILLLGEEKLLDLIATGDHSSLVQRLTRVITLLPLSTKEIIAYIHHRLKAAAGELGLFPANVLNQVVLLSRGVPKIINDLCDLALAEAFQNGRSQTDVGSLSAEKVKGVLGHKLSFLSEEQVLQKLNGLLKKPRPEIPPVVTPRPPTPLVLDDLEPAESMVPASTSTPKKHRSARPIYIAALILIIISLALTGYTIFKNTYWEEPPSSSSPQTGGAPLPPPKGSAGVEAPRVEQKKPLAVKPAPGEKKEVTQPDARAARDASAPRQQPEATESLKIEEGLKHREVSPEEKAKPQASGPPQPVASPQPGTGPAAMKMDPKPVGPAPSKGEAVKAAAPPPAPSTPPGVAVIPKVEKLGEILFAPGQIELSPEELVKITALVSKIKIKPYQEIFILGQADNLPLMSRRLKKLGTNEAVALARAQKVAEALAHKGIEPGKMRIASQVVAYPPEVKPTTNERKVSIGLIRP